MTRKQVLQILAPAKQDKSTESKFTNVSVTNEGDRIVLPRGMTHNQAIEWLTRDREANEKEVNIRDQIECFPMDGIIALMRALKEKYGSAALSDTPSFFGPRPPVLVQVPTKDGFETAPYGRIEPLGWEGGFIQTMVEGEASLVIGGTIKRKFEPDLKDLIRLTREQLKSASIYRGQAVTIDLSYIEEGRDFEPLGDAPKFFDLNGIGEPMLILPRHVMKDLASNIWMLIERTEHCLKNNIPIKHGALFFGPPGGGKTLCGKVTAKKCVDNGWTFLYCKWARHLAQVLRLAVMYGPAVVFCEDIDETTDGDRGAFLNQLLNTLSGVDTKGKPIITVITTNHPESINPTLLRCERIDTIIEFALPDQETAERFIHLYAVDDDGHSVLAPDADVKPAAESLKGFMPAFIAEAVQKAKRYAMYREPSGNIRGKVTSQDVVDAAHNLTRHAEMASRQKTHTQAEAAAMSLQNVLNYGLRGHITHEMAPNKK